MASNPRQLRGGIEQSRLYTVGRSSYKNDE